MNDSVNSSPLKTERFLELVKSKLLEDDSMDIELHHLEINITNLSYITW